MCILSTTLGLSLGLGLGTTLALALSEVAVVGGVVGGVVSTVAGVQQAQQQQAQAEYMASVEEKNAKLAARQAEQIGLQGDQERQQLRTKMLLASGQARSSYAANGVVLGRGSAADYEADIADAYDLDSKNLDYDIAMRQWKLRVEAGNATDQASLYKAQASAYQQSQTTSLLSGMFNTVGGAAKGIGSYAELGEKRGVWETLSNKFS
jgi:hypothetical protein